MSTRFLGYASFAFALFLVIALGFVPNGAYASTIATADIVAIPKTITGTGSGNGTLDLRMFTFSGSQIENADKKSGFNGDNGNNQLPQGGGGGDIHSFAESYVTTAGDLKAFYTLNFPDTTINEILLFLDLNEIGGGEPTNTLGKLDLILNPTSINGSPGPSGDVSSDQQAAINQIYTGGIKIASLDPEPAANMPVNEQGAGWADYAIFTGIDVFALNDSDVLLFNISMSNLSNGSEEIFLSGEYAPSDFPGYEPPDDPDDPDDPDNPAVPEPTSLLLLGTGLGVLGLATWYRRK